MFLNKKRIVKALVSTAVLTIIVTGLYGCGFKQVCEYNNIFVYIYVS